MIRPVLLVARAGCRRRWPGLVGIAVLVAVFSGSVLVGLVGAHRSATSVDRFRQWSESSDVEFQFNTVDQAVAIKLALQGDPAVSQASLRYLANAFPISSGAALPDFAIISDPDGEFGVTIDRIRVLSGRMPAPNAPNEVILNEIAAQLLDVAPGDHLPVMTWSSNDLTALSTGTGFAGFNGPHVDLVVVGVGRWPFDLPGGARRGDLLALAGPRFLATNNAIGAWPPAVEVRLTDHRRDLTEVAERVQAAAGQTTASGPQLLPRAQIVTAADQYIDTTRKATNGLAVGLIVFALVAAAAGLLASAQGASREAREARGSDATLAALGMDRASRTLAIALPIFGAGMVGVIVGACSAVVASPSVPRGKARLAEVDPGIWFDPVVLAAGIAVVVAAVGGVAVVSAGRATRYRVEGAVSARATFTSWTVNTFGLGPVTATGLRRASPARRRSGSSPGRSAMVGMAVAIGGILAAGTVVRSVDSLQSDPAHWGWTWTTRPDAFGEGDPSPALAVDGDLDGVGLLSTANVTLDGNDYSNALALTVRKGDLAFTLLDGRLPSSAAEVAVGRQTLRDLGVSIGDTIEALSSDGETTTTLRVVGTTILPPIELATLDQGAVLTPDGLTQIAQGSPNFDVVLRYRSGVDVAALEMRLADKHQLSFPVASQPEVPGSITNIAESSGVAGALAAFFVLIGLVGLANALTTSIRRDGHEFGVLRALGLRGRQVWVATLVQALTLSAVGVVAGVPLGLVAGRAVWRAMSNGLGIAANPQVPWPLIWAVLPATAVATALVCWWPGRFAARSRPATQLRGA